MKKQYEAPLTDIVRTETAAMLAASQPEADIPVPGIEDSRLFGEEDDGLEG